MPVIYCRINLGDLRQTIYFVDDKASTPLGEIETELLPGFIAFHCKENNINKVALNGPKDYAEFLGDEVKKSAQANFNLADIEIEFMNE